MNQKFEKIYGDESDSVFRFCLVRVSNKEQALDITQETFLRFWNNLLKGEEIRNYRAFLFTIAHNLIIDWYRKKKSISLESIMNDEKEITWSHMDEKLIENDLELEAEGRFLLEKIKEISSTCRDSVYLRFVEGLSPGEIGEILGISANMVSVRVNRGLIELREKTGYSNSNPKRELKDNRENK